MHDATAAARVQLQAGSPTAEPVTTAPAHDSQALPAGAPEPVALEEVAQRRPPPKVVPGAAVATVAAALLLVPARVGKMEGPGVSRALCWVLKAFGPPHTEPSCL